MRRLDVFGHAGGAYRYKALDYLWEAAPLLPGLRELSFKTRGAHVSATLLDAMLKLFLVESLTSISATGALPRTVPWLTYSAAVPVVKHISVYGRELRRLDFYVRLPLNTGWPELVAALTRARLIVELGLGCDMLDNAVLAAVGALPELETLKLLGHIESAHMHTGLQASNGSFATLLALELLDFSIPQIRFLLAVRPLFSNLHSLTLLFSAGGENTFTLGRLFQALSQGCPRLESLTCRFLGGALTQIPPESIAPLQRIPLRRLFFHNVRLAGQSNCSLLHGHWPGLTHLSWRAQRATLQDLRMFAGRPGLTLLGVSLRHIDDPGPAGPVVDPINPRPAMFRLESDFALNHLTLKGVDNFAW